MTGNLDYTRVLKLVDSVLFDPQPPPAFYFISCFLRDEGWVPENWPDSVLFLTKKQSLPE